MKASVLACLRAGLLICAAAGALGAAGCSRKVGDDCRVSVDCSVNGDRSCDISQPGGYCTIEGCDEKSCPDEAVCVRFFPERFLSTAASCNPDPELPSGCAADEVCLPDGRCAPRASERRYCALSCGGDGDCRGGYRCRKFLESAGGAYSVTEGGRSPGGFCSPTSTTPR